ncbi:GNAT family N-acetyltransferase [Paenibacillus albidus]|uniref:GNAT family N-acetyltransferase n=1 Tax=Paenibacillus albidus TaxID=2041023 RepID=UPI0035D0138A
MNLSIRQVQQADAPELCRLMKQLNGKELPLADMERRLEFIKTSPIEELYVCTTGEGHAERRLCGALGFRLRENIEDMTRYGEVSLLVADRSSRRQGIGRRLMAYAEQLADERGCLGTWLVSGLGRAEEAHVFYKELGYEINGYRFVKVRENH